MSYKEKLLNLMDIIYKEGASDLHLAEDRPPILRANSTLFPVSEENDSSKEDMEGFLDELLSPDAKEFFLKNSEVDFSYSPGEKVRFRGNAYLQQGRLCIALRLIPKEIQTFEELNLPSSLEKFANMEQGFFLVVGPTGHGKSTTLASIIEYINQNRSEHIITVEDPIEYIFEPKKSIIDQREVRADTPDFHTALKSMFRQDVDVLMVGEMRESETISTAVTAAETGHLVLSTLHTNTASQTIERIIDSFSSGQQDQIRSQLAGSLAGIFSIRLIPKVSGGLIPAYELLINNSAVANLIRDKRTHEINSVIETSFEEGMITLNSSLARLVQSGDITMDSAFMHSNNSNTLKKLL